METAAAELDAACDFRHQKGSYFTVGKCMPMELQSQILQRARELREAAKILHVPAPAAASTEEEACL